MLTYENFDFKRVGSALRLCMYYADLTQREFAERAGVSENTVDFALRAPAKNHSSREMCHHLALTLGYADCNQLVAFGEYLDYAMMHRKHLPEIIHTYRLKNDLSLKKMGVLMGASPDIADQFCNGIESGHRVLGLHGAMSIVKHMPFETMHELIAAVGLERAYPPPKERITKPIFPPINGPQWPAYLDSPKNHFDYMAAAKIFKLCMAHKHLRMQALADKSGLSKESISAALYPLSGIHIGLATYDKIAQGLGYKDFTEATAHSKYLAYAFMHTEHMGEIIKAWRTKKGLSQSVAGALIAPRIANPISYCSDIERKKYIPSLIECVNILKNIGIDNMHSLIAEAGIQDIYPAPAEIPAKPEFAATATSPAQKSLILHVLKSRAASLRQH